MRTVPLRRPGFTLIELLVGLAVGSIVVLGVASSFVAVFGAYQSEAQIKTAVEQSRTGLDYLERVVHLAGYGIDPRYAFDFDTAALASLESAKDNYPSAPAGFATDDLAFRYRDPAFLRRGTLDFAGTSIVLEPGTSFGVALRQGQPLIIACASGGDYLVLRTTEARAATDSTAAVIPYADPFPIEIPPCVNTGDGETAPLLFLMYDVRIRVVEHAGQPYLMAFYELADPSSSTDYAPIAAGVENFQVAYVMNRPPVSGGCCSGNAAPDAAGNANWVLHDVAGEPGPDRLAAAPTYDTSYDDAARYDLHPANIRAVRLSLVVRNNRATRLGSPRAAVEDQGPWGAADGFFRTTVSTTVSLPNLQSRTFFIPPLKPGGATTDLNVGGG